MDLKQPRGSHSEPCPERIIDKAGHGFSGGFIGGAAFHFLKGIYNSPKGTRFIRGREAAIMNAPRIGGEYAIFCATYSALDCTVFYARQKDDPWNSIISSFLTGGLFGMRKGLRFAMWYSVSFASFTALLEGTGIMLDRFSGVQRRQEQQLQQQQPPGPSLLQLQHDTKVSPASSFPSP